MFLFQTVTGRCGAVGQHVAVLVMVELKPEQEPAQTLPLQMEVKPAQDPAQRTCSATLSHAHRVI